MKYLHTMVRVNDLDASLDFYCNKLGLVLTRKNDYPNGRFTLAFVSAREHQAKFVAVKIERNVQIVDADHRMQIFHVGSRRG